MKQQSPCCIEAHRDAAVCHHDVQVESTARRPSLEIDERPRALVALAQEPSAADFRSRHLLRLFVVVASRATYSGNSDLNCPCLPVSVSPSLHGTHFDGVVRASLHFAMVKTTTMMMQSPNSQQRPVGANDAAGDVAAILCAHGATASHSSWPAKDARSAARRLIIGSPVTGGTVRVVGIFCSFVHPPTLHNDCENRLSSVPQNQPNQSRIHKTEG
jgi:hypothetical protein